MVKKSEKLCREAPKVSLELYNTKTQKIKKRTAKVRKATKGKGKYVVCAKNSQYRLKDHNRSTTQKIPARTVLAIGDENDEDAKKYENKNKLSSDKNVVAIVKGVKEIEQHHSQMIAKIKESIKNTAKKNKEKSKEGIKKIKQIEKNATLTAQKEKVSEVSEALNEVSEDSTQIVNDADKITNSKEASKLQEDVEKNETSKKIFEKNKDVE